MTDFFTVFPFSKKLSMFFFNFLFGLIMTVTIIKNYLKHNKV